MTALASPGLSPAGPYLLLSTLLPLVSSEINCFRCSSRNGSNEACEDPFNPAMSTYVRSCKVPKRNHVGEFPANFCVKVSGVSTRTGEQLVIRQCILKSMESQCGDFKFEGETLHGCVLTCNYDGCNGAISARTGALTLLATALGALLWTG